jgi:hypothetical protein
LNPAIVKLPFFLLAILPVINLCGQNSFSTGDPDALFSTLEDLLHHHADTSCHLRKVDDVRVDSLVQRCWFTDQEKGMIKDVFAVRCHGQLYFQEQAVRQNLPCTFHPHARKESNCFYPILEQGRYFVFEMLSEDKSPDLSIAMGLMGGVMGSAFGNTLTPPEMIRSSIILETSTKSFYGIDTWRDIELFLNANYPNNHISIGSGHPDPAAVRQLLISLNNQ